MLHLITVEEATYRLLQQLFEISFIRENFALAGGTSLALQIGHRKSIDLDLFSPVAFNVKELEIILAGNSNIQFEYTGNNSRMLFCYINQIKCDFVNEPALLIDPFENKNGVLYYSVKDIAAMKMHTVCGRGKKKNTIRNSYTFYGAAYPILPMQKMILKFKAYHHILKAGRR